MLFIQLTGLSGAGKTSIANEVQSLMNMHSKQLTIEVIDADDFRKTVSKDLGFSKDDRIENIRRLGTIAAGYTAKGCITIVAAINPFVTARAELKQRYNAKTVWIKCPVDELIKRDTKGLYRRALLDRVHPDKINNLTGINDPYEPPDDADLIINTELEDLDNSALKLTQFIMTQLNSNS